MIQKILNFINQYILGDNSHLINKANLTENHVSAIARNFAKELGWKSEGMQIPDLISKDDSLIWQVRFFDLDENGLLLRGGVLFMEIDDQSGELVRKTMGGR